MTHDPLARDKALVPLSRGHQRGLRLARRIGRGEAVAADVEAAWHADLDPHFKAEEDLLFPLSESAHVERVRRDHSWMRWTRTELVRYPADAELIAAFGAVLKAHIRFEERVWFEALQKSLGRERLAALDEEMHARFPDAE